MRKLVLCVILLLLLAGRVYALETAELEKALPAEAAEAMDGLSPTEQTNLWDGLKSILETARSQTDGLLRGAAVLILRMLAIVTVCRLAEEGQGEPMRRAAAMAGALGVAACCATDLRGMIGLGQKTMEELLAFSNLLLPVMASAAAASGGTVSAGGLYAAASLFSNLLIRFSHGILIPAVYGYLALALADCAVQQERLKKLRELLGWSIRNGLKGAMYLFTGFLAVTGILSGTADAAALKAAKMAFSGMIPVVGGIMSDAAETVLAGAGLMKNAIGTYGLLAVAAISLMPFLRMGVQFMGFKMTGALSGVMGSRLCGLLDAVSEAMGYLLAMTAGSAFLILMACCCLMQVSSL